MRLALIIEFSSVCRPTLIIAPTDIFCTFLAHLYLDTYVLANVSVSEKMSRLHHCLLSVHDANKRHPDKSRVVQSVNWMSSPRNVSSALLSLPGQDLTVNEWIANTKLCLHYTIILQKLSFDWAHYSFYSHCDRGIPQYLTLSFVYEHILFELDRSVVLLFTLVMNRYHDFNYITIRYGIHIL